MQVRLKHITFPLCAAGLLFASCGDTPEQAKKEEIKDTIALQPQTEVVGEVTYTLPSPVQIASIFKKSGLKYYEGITNPAGPEKYEGSNTFWKALNLGVFSADLSYTILNKQSEESRKYFKSCKELAGDLGFGKAFEMKNVAQRMEKNLANQDSLSTILADIQMEADNILSESDREHISVISFTGAWIESMYIGIQVHMREKNTDIAAKLVEQMTIADNVIKALQPHIDKEKEIPNLIKHMQTLNEIYNGFASVKEIKATDPDVIDPAKLNVSVSELLAFSEKLQQIRNQIIKH